MKDKEHLCVQSTNNSSIHSKLSAVRNGYIEDEFIACFCTKTSRRSPLINRGYFVRAKAVGHVLETYCNRMKGDSCQVLSLGAGFDTSFFRLKALGVLPERCRYYEVDLPGVVKRKCEIIANTPRLSGLVGSPTGKNTWSEYSIIAQDLTDVGSLEIALANAGISFELPTLVFAECVLSYLHVRDSNAVISWTSKKFLNIAVVVYEQVNPDDGFGMFMCQHFEKIGSPLRSLKVYPGVDSQRSRYLSLNYETCACVGMNEFYSRLDEAEKTRVRSLEPFDEFEEWHAKCDHYALVVATKGQGGGLASIFATEGVPERLPVPVQCDWKPEEAPRSLRRFGHVSVLASERNVLTLFGFADDGGRHGRVFRPVLTDLVTNETLPVEICGFAGTEGRQHAAAIRFSDGSLLVNGGRTSPLHACPDDFFLLPDRTNPPSYTLEHTRRSKWPEPRWRHTLQVARARGREVAILFGGRTVKQMALDDCHIYDVEAKSWSEVPHSGETPGRRHSHAAVTVCDSRMLVTCGLGDGETPLDSIHSFDADRLTWKKIHVTGLRGRHGHTAHFVPPNFLCLVGGVGTNNFESCGIAVVDLFDNQCTEVTFPNQNPERPITIFNHQSVIHDGWEVVVIGGGGNCFSFGTHFNDCFVKVDVKTCLAHLKTL